MFTSWIVGTCSRKQRASLLALFDSASWGAASFAGLTLTESVPPDRGATASAVVAGAAVVSGHLAGAYSSRWRVGEFQSSIALARQSIVGFLALAVVFLIAGGVSSIPAAIGTAAAATLQSGTARAWWRHATERSRPQHPPGDDAPQATPAIVFGAGSGGRLILEALQTNPSRSLVPVGILDDDPTLHGREIAGLSVTGGRGHLRTLAEQTGASELVIAIPSADRDLIRSLAEQARQVGLHPSVVPSVAALVNNVVHPDDIRNVTPADLLGRRPVDMNTSERGSYVCGKVVLVTGAGGSIGSELCLQLHRLGPDKLVMLDRDESALHALQLSIDGMGQLSSESLVVADIRDTERVRDIFRQWKPDIVFHAAALKHLPLLEMHPHEGLKTNVLGSHNLLSAAAEFDTARFVNVSTDKAADPTSVLGWTKHLAERLTTRIGLDNNRPYLSVRFGNVLGSRGSVLTAFTRQIEQGGPITVTHPDVTRFFMTVEEAASLVIAAGGSDQTGDVMILEMGEPVSILQMAQDLIAKSGQKIEVLVTGLRPGEKMHEVLRSDTEAIVKTDDGLMWRGAIEPINWNDVEPLFEIEDPQVLVAELDRIGGPPAKLGADNILMSPPEIGDAERGAVLRALDSGWIAPAGAELDLFEKEIVEYTGAEAAMATQSGTGALHLALIVSGVKPGDDVVVQTTTFAASAFAVCHAGANPVFCDTDSATGMMDPELLSQFLAERARQGRLPAAVMPVDLYGLCADYDRIVEACSGYNIPVIQDAAEALGAKAQGRNAGTHGTLGVFSFNGNKIITTSGGGALVGPPELIARANKLGAQAREIAPHYEHAEIGFNYRMSNILAALGRAQLERLDDRIMARAAVVNRYHDSALELDWMTQGVTERPNNWLNVARLSQGVDPEHVVSTMLDLGIEVRRSWKPMHLQPVFAANESIGGKNAEEFFARGICLPSAQSLSATQLDRVITDLGTVIEQASHAVLTGR